ncbi:MAG: peptidoglycan-N-acetylglucosamine deacetylase [Miltoncostaeaceae bacterium]|nr:peptidoglycan-N-acetylglucosamine deacetylase [Miltoncostaeaceae bacterium]
MARRAPAAAQIAAAAGGTALAGAAIAYWGPALSVLPPARKALARVMLSQAPAGRPEVALTFDDGPDPRLTERFLAALDGVPATFFWLGQRVRQWPSLAVEAMERGHEVACHGDDHRRLAALGPRATVESLRRAHVAIADAAGRPPRFYRPAYGVFNLAAWHAAPRLGMRRTMWSRWARDWEARATPELIASRTVAGLRSGAILLLHDADGSSGAPERTLRALPRIIDAIHERGLRPVTLSRLVAQS